MSISKTLGLREYIFKSQEDFDVAKKLYEQFEKHIHFKELTQNDFEDMLDGLKIDFTIIS